MARVCKSTLRHSAQATVQTKPSRLKAHLGAQFVHGKALHQHRREARVHIEQDRVASRHKKEIRNILALGCQHGGVDQPMLQPCDVIAHKPL
jgi:hypothetical protein